MIQMLRRLLNIQSDPGLHQYQVPEKVNIMDVDGVPPPEDIVFLLPSVAEMIVVVGATESTVQYTMQERHLHVPSYLLP